MFISDNFKIPHKIIIGDFYLEVLSRKFADQDYEAVMSSKEKLRKVFAENDTWPKDNMSFEEIEKKYSKDGLKLYKLILNRAISSQMANRQSEIITAEISCKGKDGQTYGFRLSAEKLLFDGFRVVWGSEEGKETEGEDKLALVEGIEEGEVYLCESLDKLQKFTKPKPRYTEASLVKKLESYGIGRPSTYASIISTIVDRGYVGKEQKTLFPKDVGVVVNSFIEQNFMRLVDYEYTAEVESELDDIAIGKVQYAPFIDSQYKPLVKELDDADRNVDKEDVVVLGLSEEKCPECGGKMVVKIGKYGKFLSCAKFPECKGIKGLSGEGDKSDEPLVLDETKFLPASACPKCGGEMVMKSGRYGNFWTCKDYPKCKGVASLLLKENCPECGKPLVERKGRWGKTFIGCSGYPDCRYIKGSKGKGKKTGKGRAKTKVEGKGEDKPKTKSNSRSKAKPAKKAKRRVAKKK